MSDMDNNKKTAEEKLKFLRRILDALPVEIWYKETDGTYAYVNEGWAELIGKKAEECIGKKDYEIFDEHLTAIYRQSDWDILSGAGSNVVKTVTLEGNATVEFKNAFREEDGTVSGIVGCAIERRFDELQKSLLEDTRGIFRIIFDGSPLGMSIYDQDSDVPLFVNNRYCEILGISEYTALNTGWRFLTHPEDIGPNLVKEHEIKSGDINSFKLEKRFIKSNGDIVWTIMTVIKLPAEISGEYLMLCIFEDITEHKKAQQDVEYLNYHDPLTDCYNRRYYNLKVPNFDIESYYPLSLLMADIDGLKLVNDEFGHAEGDKLLKSVADVLKAYCREDDLLARTDGDEFVILMPWTPKYQADERAFSIKQEIEGLKNLKKTVNISVGVATKDKNDISIEELYKKAEDKMYHNKIKENGNIQSEALAFITKALYQHSEYAQKHSENVRNYCMKMGEAMGMSSFEISNLKIAGLFHDIGLIDLSMEAHLDKTKRTKDDIAKYEKHPTLGYHLIKLIHGYSEAAEIVFCHHERFDGQGFPRGLKAKEIHKGAYIVAVADAYDNMRRGRREDEKLSKEAAIRALREEAGKKFDPDIVEIFIKKVLK